MTEISKIEQWRAELVVAETFEEIKLLEDAAAAAAVLAKRQGMLKEKQQEIGVALIEIVRKKGAWLDEHFPSKGVGNRFTVDSTNKEPSTMPVNKKESAASRVIAREDEKAVNTIVNAIIAENGVPTMNSVANEIKRRNRPEPKKRVIVKVDGNTIDFEKMITEASSLAHRINLVAINNIVPEDKPTKTIFTAALKELYAAMLRLVEEHKDYA